MLEQLDHPVTDRRQVGEPDLAVWLAHYGPALRRYFGRRVGDIEVDDLVQEVFLRLHAARRDTPIDNVDRYMFTVARNVLVSRHRSDRARGGPFHQTLEGMNEPVDHLSPERIAIGSEEYARAVRAIVALPPRARAAFQFHRFENMTYQSIAQRMGISKESVKELIHRALVRIAEQMEAEA
ncbi:RNA polymerase sigma factor [Sphingomonas gilva]|uniref:RNA polymerase sigma factor n=1 Tax=Sphingomonas gilva TaxID=2305907 RepID=A0A396S6L8_9SPHN|nr:RNA polymerase sigma factor [Sphingomonas gilva]RHW19065.1 RNA polymerase sigma factor [Sphingomonas gilva]